MRPLYLLLTLMFTASWGFNFAFAKMALQELPLFAMMAVRFFVVALLVLPFYRKPPIPLKYMFVIAFVFSIPHVGANFGGMMLGLDAGMATLVQQANAPFLLLLNVLVHKEKIGKQSIIGIILCFIGTYFLMQAPTSLDAPMGFALSLVGAFFWGVYSLLLKRVKNVPALSLIGWMSLCAVPINGVMSLIFEDHQVEAFVQASLSSWLILGFMIVVASLGAHALWYYLLSRVPTDRLAPTTLMIPLWGVLAGVLLLDETISSQMLVGGVIMLVGVGIVLIRRPTVYRQEVDV